MTRTTRKRWVNERHANMSVFSTHARGLLALLSTDGSTKNYVRPNRRHRVASGLGVLLGVGMSMKEVKGCTQRPHDYKPQDKTARIAWALLANGEVYKAPVAMAA